MNKAFKALLTTKTGDVISLDVFNFDKANLVPGNRAVVIVNA